MAERMIMPAMSLGQVTEIIGMSAVLAFLMGRFGIGLCSAWVAMEGLKFLLFSAAGTDILRCSAVSSVTASSTRSSSPRLHLPRPELFRFDADGGAPDLWIATPVSADWREASPPGRAWIS
jgi:hypothetical protein